MSSNYVFFHAFWHASLIVKLVMLLLLAASILSWTIIFYRSRSLRLLCSTLDDFNHLFTNEQNVIARYQAINHHQLRTPLEKLFIAGFDEHLKLKQQGVSKAKQLMKGAKRVMNIISLTEIEQLEQGLATLATIGSVSPYVGLFGTVWGIMSSFHALQGGQASITSVAPGISEALIATAMGLFAAIPAVIAYNRFMSTIDRIINRFDLFQQQFANYLYHQSINQEDDKEQNHDPI